MTNDRLGTARRWVTLVLAAGMMGGCSSSLVELTSYKDAYFPEHYQARLEECAYYLDPAGDIHAVGRSQHTDEHGTLTQYVHVHIFWKPWPGKTPADQTSTDAVIRYILARSSGCAVYEGTGFAFPRRQRGGELRIDIESAYLRPLSQSGELPDVLGSARLKGTLRAANRPGSAAHLVREMDRLAGP